MGLSNSCIRHFQDVFIYMMPGPGESQMEVIPSEGEGAVNSRAGTGRESTAESVTGNGSVQQRIQDSIRHWSQLTTELDCMSAEEHEAVEVDNRAVFQELQSHPRWSHFLCTFGYDTEVCESVGELEVGLKFAEDAQAELFHAHVTWKSSMMREQDKREGLDYVLKVFKKGTLLRHLQSQWPEGMFVQHADIVERTELGKPQPFRFESYVWCGTLLRDGRFAFLMAREEEDLRSVIDRNMLTNDGRCGPFSLEECERMLYRIALGMNQLHNLNIVHRDLKASNVLIANYGGGNHFESYIANYECSIGVVETGVFRAPEVLQALKDKTMKEETFTKEVDVYSYGMVCYEILTGKIPFEYHRPRNDFDIVINGKRPQVPKYVRDWICDMLKWCWQSDPKARPTFGDILKLLLEKSAASRVHEERMTFGRENITKIQ